MAFTSLVISAIMTRFKELLHDIPVLEKVVYNPDMSFDPIFRKNVVEIDKHFKDAQSSPNWVGIMWNRESLRRCEEQQRRFRVWFEDKANAEADMYSMGFVDLTLNVAFVSPSISLVENVEERLLFNDPEGPVQFTHPTLGVFDANVKRFEVSSIRREDSNTAGTIALIETQVITDYPIIELDTENVPIIRDIILTIESGIYNATWD